jgi:DNA-binding response OmpR family regulator
MDASRAILFVKSEKNSNGPSLDILSALRAIGCQLMIADFSLFENMGERFSPVLIIASLPGHPKTDLHLCHLLLQAAHSPVIVISPLDDCDCRIAALDAGVADFLVSPISPLELSARVKNILHRRICA